MALSRFILPFADVGSGIRPSANSQMFFYATGTTTPKDTFNCPDGTTANSNPVVSDINGLFPDIFVTGTYKVVLQDKNGDQQWEADPVASIGTGSDLTYVVTAEFLSTTSFKALGDHTSVFVEGARVALGFSDSDPIQSTVISSLLNAGDTEVTIEDAIVTSSVETASISNGIVALNEFIEDGQDAIDTFNAEGDAAIADIETRGDAAIDALDDALVDFDQESTDQLAAQESTFQNRFAFSQPPIAWTAFTLIEDELQLYTTGIVGESGYAVWLADPAQLPFTTSATFAEDDALNRWQDDTNATKAWAQSSEVDASLNTALSSGSTTSRSMADRFADYANVLDFGAVGDGVTDDASAIRLAIATGKSVVFPGGLSYFVASGETSTPIAPHNPTGVSYFTIDTDGQVIEVNGEIIYKNDNASSNNPNLFFVSADNVRVSGGKFKHDTIPNARNIHSGNAVAPFEVSNFTFENAHLDHVRQGCIIYNSLDSQIVNCYHQSSLAGIDGVSAAFKIRGGSGNLISNCTSYYSLSDGNMGIFGTGSGNKITDCNLYNRDIDGNPGLNTGQGISIDSGQQYASVTNNVVEDFYYNIDVKTNINGCQVIGNVIKTKKIAISVRWGEGSQNVNGCTIANNSIVFSEGQTDPTPAIFYHPVNPSDDSGGYTTLGILVEKLEGAVSITGNNFGPDLDDGEGSVRAACIVVKANTDKNSAREDKCGVVIADNVFRMIQEIGVATYRINGPIVGINGNVNAYGTELPTINFVGNTIKLPNKTDATAFSCIDGNYLESLVMTGNSWVYDAPFGPVVYLESSRAISISDNVFGALSSTILRAITADTVTYTGNTSYSANLNSTDVNLTDCDTVICNSNVFKRGEITGFAVRSEGVTSNFIAIGNYAEGAATAIYNEATNEAVANNIIKSV